MANWKSMVAHIKSKYRVLEESEGLLALRFETVDGRDQIVFFQRGGNDKIGEWAQVTSAIANYSAKTLEAACREAHGLLCGGITIIEDKIMLSDSIPLANLDANEIEQPLMAITFFADMLERKFTGGDKF